MKVEDAIGPMMDCAKETLCGIAYCPPNGHNGREKIFASILRDLAEKIERKELTVGMCVEKCGEFSALARACTAELEAVKP